MNSDLFVLLEARHRQSETLAWANRQRLLEQAYAADKARRSRKPGMVARLLVRLGRFFEASGRRLQKRFGPEPMETCSTV